MSNARLEGGTTGIFPVSTPMYILKQIPESFGRLIYNIRYADDTHELQ